MTTATQRIIATRVSARHNWPDINDKYPGLSRVMHYELRRLYLEHDLDNLNVSSLAWKHKVSKSAWETLEQRLFRKPEDILKFENSLDPKELSKGILLPQPYFTKDVWIKDAGPTGKKIRDIIEDAASEYL